jgi:hypothetical protein
MLVLVNVQPFFREETMPIVQRGTSFEINDPCPVCSNSGLKPVLVDLIRPAASSRAKVTIRRKVISWLICGQCNGSFEANDANRTTDEVLTEQVEAFQRLHREPKRCPKCRKLLKGKGTHVPSWMERVRIADGRTSAPKSDFARRYTFCKSCYIVTWVIPAPREPWSTKKFLLKKRS